LSGEVFKLDEGGPVPPAHVNCRSTIVAELDEDFAFLKEGRTQASQFGPVDQKMTYYDWLKKQPQPFQDQVLGRVKGKLFREGGLSTKQFQKLVRADNYTPITLSRMEKLAPLAFEKAGIQILPSGRAVVGSGAQAVIQAVSNEQLGLSGPRKLNNNPDMDKWRKAGTFDSPRLATIEAAVDDPLEVNSQKGRGAYYQGLSKEIQMASYSAAEEAGRGVMRHEWGHYLDDMLGRLAISKKNTFSRELLEELAGSPIDVLTSRYISGWSKPVKALRGDARKLLSMGRRMFKQMSPSSRARIFNNQRVYDAWRFRREALVRDANEAGVKAAKEARKGLKESDHLIARLWRRMVDNPDFSVSMIDDRMFWEALKADDLSVLFMERGTYLRAALRSVDTQDGHAVMGAITDAIGAATKGDFGDYFMGWGHGKGYYKTRGMHGQATEAFAEMTQLEKVRRADALVDDLVRAIMPEFSAWYDEVIDRLNGLLAGGG
jgi:hypothetical protein